MSPAVANPPTRESENRAWKGRTAAQHRQERQVHRSRPPEDTTRRRFAGASDDGRLTLERKLDRVWEGLTVAGAHAEGECPVCQSPMERQGALAKCGGCGSTLS